MAEPVVSVAVDKNSCPWTLEGGLMIHACSARAIIAAPEDVAAWLSRDEQQAILETLVACSQLVSIHFRVTDRMHAAIALLTERLAVATPPGPVPSGGA